MTMKNPTILDINPFSTNISPALGELLHFDSSKTNAYCLADELSSLLTLLDSDRDLLSAYAEIAAGYEPREECSEQDARDCQTLYLITRFHQKTGIMLDVDAAEHLMEAGRRERKAKGKKSLKMAESIDELATSAIPILRKMAFSRVRFLMRGIEWDYFPDFGKDSFVDYWTSDIARRTGFSYQELRPIVCEGVHSARQARAALYADLLAEAILQPHSREASYLGSHPTSTNDAPWWLSETSGLPVTNTAPLFSKVFTKKSNYYQFREVNSWTWDTIDKPPKGLSSPDFPRQAIALLGHRIHYANDALPSLVTNAVLNIRTNLVLRYWSNEEVSEIAKSFSHGNWDTNRLHALYSDMASRSGLPEPRIKQLLAEPLFREYADELNSAIQSGNPPPFHRKDFAKECSAHFLGLVDVPERKCKKKIGGTVDFARMVVAEHLASRAGSAFAKQETLEGTIAEEILRIRDRIAKATGAPPGKIEPIVKKEIESNIDDRNEYLADLHEERRNNSEWALQDYAEDIQKGKIPGFETPAFLASQTDKMAKETGLGTNVVHQALARATSELSHRLSLARPAFQDIRAMTRSGMFPTEESRKYDLLFEYDGEISSATELDEDLVKKILEKEIEKGWKEFEEGKPFNLTDISDLKKRAIIAEMQALQLAEQMASELKLKIVNGTVKVPDREDSFEKEQFEAILKYAQIRTEESTNHIRHLVVNAIIMGQVEARDRENEASQRKLERITDIADQNESTSMENKACSNADNHKRGNHIAENLGLLALLAAIIISISAGWRWFLR